MRGASRAPWALPSWSSPHTALPRRIPHTRLLLIGFPAGVDMHHALHHAQTQAQVPRHGAWLTVLIGVLLQRRGVHRGICRVGRVESGPGLFQATRCPAQRPHREGELLPLPPPTMDQGAGMSLGGGKQAGWRFSGTKAQGVGDTRALGAGQGWGVPPADTGVSGPCS